MLLQACANAYSLKINDRFNSDWRGLSSLCDRLINWSYVGAIGKSAQNISTSWEALCCWVNSG